MHLKDGTYKTAELRSKVALTVQFLLHVDLKWRGDLKSAELCSQGSPELSLLGEQVGLDCWKSFKGETYLRSQYCSVLA